MYLHTGYDVENDAFTILSTGVDRLWQGGHRLHILALFQWGNWMRRRGFELTPRCKTILQTVGLPVSNSPCNVDIREAVKFARACFHGFGHGDEGESPLELLNPISGASFGKVADRLRRPSTPEGSATE